MAVDAGTGDKTVLLEGSAPVRSMAVGGEGETVRGTWLVVVGGGVGLGVMWVVAVMVMVGVIVSVVWRSVVVVVVEGGGWGWWWWWKEKW